MNNSNTLWVEKYRPYSLDTYIGNEHLKSKVTIYLQNIPDFELSIHITPTVINKFIAGKSALQDATTFTVITANNFTKLVIGHSVTLTDRVTIPVNTQDFQHIKEVSFNAEYFSQILLANKECESAILYVSSAGLCKISFKIDNYSSAYWLVGTTELA